MSVPRPSVDFATGDHYAVLGVPREATESDIHRAYKNLARLHHPDKNPNSRAEAEVSFKRIAEAYAVLRDPARRREYDSSGGASRSYVSYEEAEQLWRSFGGGGEGGEAAAAAAAHNLLRDEEGRRKVLALVAMLATLVFAPRLVMTMLPGLTAALLCVALLWRRDNNGKLAWLAMALLLLSFAAPWMLRLRAGMGAGSPTGPEMPGGAAVTGRAPPLRSPHSGELVFVDGGFVRLWDPLLREQGGDLASGGVEEGWEKRLLTSMTTAIKGGQEQVLMIFSRQGCPWCDRLVPVLQRAIVRRAGGVEDPEMPDVMDEDEVDDEPENDVEAPAQAPALAPAAANAFVLPGGGIGAPAFLGPAAVPGPVPAGAGGLVYAPLRVFVFDAGEFPYLAQTFRIEAFPTIVAWGAPGVTPMAAQGYLDDENLDQLLKTAATAAPGRGGSRGGKKRRGLFR